MLPFFTDQHIYKQPSITIASSSLMLLSSCYDRTYEDTSSFLVGARAAPNPHVSGTLSPGCAAMLSPRAPVSEFFWRQFQGEEDVSGAAHPSNLSSLIAHNDTRLPPSLLPLRPIGATLGLSGCWAGSLSTRCASTSPHGASWQCRGS